MLKLFALRDTKTNKLVPGEFFGNKVKAKERRNELNTAEGEDKRFVVTYGPDHWKFSAK